MRLKNFILILIVFLIQTLLSIGYLRFHDYQNIFGAASIIIPMIGYSIIAFRLPIFRPMSVAVRALIALAVSFCAWFMGSWISLIIIICLRIVPPR